MSLVLFLAMVKKPQSFKLGILGENSNGTVPGQMNRSTGLLRLEHKLVMRKLKTMVHSGLVSKTTGTTLVTS